MQYNVIVLIERTPIVIQLCLRSPTGLWENYYYAPFDITHYISSNVGFADIVWSTGQFGAEMKYGVPTVQEQWCDVGHILLG